MPRRDDEILVPFEFGEIINGLSQIREEMATLRNDIGWLKGITEGICKDIEDLKAFKWKVYGISVGISTVVSFVMYFLK